MWPILKKFPIFSIAIAAAIFAAVLTRKVGLFAEIACGIAVLWMGWRIVHWLMEFRDYRRAIRLENAHTAAATNNSEKGEPLISLVYFLEEPRQADESTIRDCFSRALEVKFDPTDEDASEFVLDINPP
ncbi:MAG: hypothetical protein HKN23_15070, partial [Verrucomicrobiales bacterium]|nr:hypothetical protein [Verrucomicrobiales bacterium]